MIWQTAAADSGEYYFTNGLNGNRIDIYQDEINEINNLIEQNNILPSFSNNTYNIVEDHELILEDTNNVLNTFNIEGENFKVENNKLIINPLKEGDYTYKLKKETTIYTPAIFYQSPNSQDLLKRGHCNELNTTINIHVSKTNIELYKTDADTKSTTPSGEAILDGAIYNLLDENHNIIEELTIDENNAIINNIDYGKYYIKEKEAGEGYTLDDKEYEIELNNEHNKIQLILENKVIEKKIIIEKKFGENNNFYNEKDISFNVFNKNKDLISTITTNSNGTAEIILPYGEYTFIQINSTEGYNKVEPFTIKVTDNEEELIELKDLKIKVPNTHTEKTNYNYLFLIIKLLLILII